MVINDYYGIPQGTEHQFWKQVDRQNRDYVTQQELMDCIYINFRKIGSVILHKNKNLVFLKSFDNDRKNYLVHK